MESKKPIQIKVSLFPSKKNNKIINSLIRDMKSKMERTFKIIFPDSSKEQWIFKARIVKFNSIIKMLNNQSVCFTFKIIGEIQKKTYKNTYKEVNPLPENISFKLNNIEFGKIKELELISNKSDHPSSKDLSKMKDWELKYIP